MNKMKCRRCGTDEDRNHGFCSEYCRDMHEHEEEIVELEAKLAEAEKARSQGEQVSAALLLDAQAERDELEAACAEYRSKLQELLPLLMAIPSGVTWRTVRDLLAAKPAGAKMLGIVKAAEEVSVAHASGSSRRDKDGNYYCGCALCAKVRDWKG